MGRILCKLCDNEEYQITSIPVDGGRNYTLRHECFPDAEEPSNVILLRGPSSKHCIHQWREIMIRRRGQTRVSNQTQENDTHFILEKWSEDNGIHWQEHIKDRASKGYTWGDVADDFEIKRERLRNFCCRRDIRFHWSKKNSPRNVVKRGHYDQYTAFGVTETLPKLVEMFGKPKGLSYSMVYRRIALRKKPMGLEEALTKPSQIRK